MTATRTLLWVVEADIAPPMSGYFEEIVAHGARDAQSPRSRTFDSPSMTLYTQELGGNNTKATQMITATR
jgi:hypothetical protein